MRSTIQIGESILAYIDQKVKTMLQHSSLDVTGPQASGKTMYPKMSQDDLRVRYVKKNLPSTHNLPNVQYIGRYLYIARAAPLIRKLVRHL